LLAEIAILQKDVDSYFINRSKLLFKIKHYKKIGFSIGLDTRSIEDRKETRKILRSFEKQRVDYLKTVSGPYRSQFR